MVDVLGTEDFEACFMDLDPKDAEAIDLVVGLLEQKGVTLGYPYSSAIMGSKYGVRELRARSGRKHLRVFYAFDPCRQAVLLIGGDKTGDDRFYETYVPRAERIWSDYLSDLRKDDNREKR